MKIIKQGRKAGRSTITKVLCPECEAALEVQDAEWNRGTYGSERIVHCPCCNGQIVKPGTEYHGDF
jgi:hypothetical protein